MVNCLTFSHIYWLLTKLHPVTNPVEYVLDYILQCIANAWGKGNCTYIEDAIDIEYADDTALLAECLE